jgi:RimJ/RimL family protein N-acetyltransferase
MATPAICLRQWEDGDLTPFAEMNADPEVMRYFPKRLTPAESRESMQRFRSGLGQRGWGLWAVEVEGAFAGFTGLSEPKFTAPFTPCVEIGWRFRREFWGRSIAFASALAAQEYGFEQLKQPQLVSFTAVSNLPSRRLMERLGFTRKEEEDFLHPALAEDCPVRPHVLYRKDRGPIDSALESGVLIPRARIAR